MRIEKPVWDRWFLLNIEVVVASNALVVLVCGWTGLGYLVLDRINRTGTTIVMATHDHAIVDAMKRRVVQLDRGRIVRDQAGSGYESAGDPTEI